MKTYPFLDLGLANKPIEDELKKAACRVIESGRYLHGEETHLLEQEVASKCEAKYCVAVSNGLDALKLIFRAYNEMGLLHEGDKVIVPANTFIASVLAVSDNGLEPVLCEPSELTMNLNPEKINGLLDDTACAPLRHCVLVGNAQTTGTRKKFAHYRRQCTSHWCQSINERT